MKRLAVFLIFLVVAGAFGPCVVSAEAVVVPHEDPSAAESSLDSLSFLTEYAAIFSLMSIGQYQNASQLSEQLSHITVPADLSYVISKYNDLTQQLIVQLDDLETTLNNASNLLDQYRLEEARDALDHAGVVIVKAQIILGDLEDATSTVVRKLGVLSAAAGSKIHHAHSELQSMLDRLQDLIDRYYRLLEAANNRYETAQSVALKKTGLTLVLNASECFVGGYVRASGYLTSSSQGMSNRAVTLLLGGKEVTTVTTNSAGAYSAAIQIPYNYVNSVSIGAYYTPVSGDKGIYLGSTSPTLKVNVLYYRTVLSASIPSTAYPGLPLTVAGNVTSQNGAALEGRQVKVLLDGVPFSQATTDEHGAFTAKSTLSSSAKLGNHTLTVSVAASGVYAGTSLQRNITITKMATTIDVDAPSFILLPAQLHINGTITSASGPLSNANVTVAFGDASASIKTQSDGTFNLTLAVPFSMTIAGDQTLKVTVQPAEVWRARAESNITVYTLNAISIGVTLALSCTILFVMYFRFAKPRQKKSKDVISTVTSNEPTLVEAAPVVIPSVVSQRNLEGVPGRLLKAYVEALTVVQSVTGYSAKPIMTLREYLQLAAPKLQGALGPFSELTSMAERTLYSRYQTEESDSKHAEELVTTIRRILYNESV
ncbi:MAG TPA: hypothetical protein VLH35_00875 [Candidatus Acidoferrales bacterium]|nr:hypothetical protein [Candidatus Acidoferrales bacterium]